MNSETDSYGSALFIKSFFDTADTQNLGKMITLLESFKQITDIVGKDDMKDFIYELIDDDSFELVTKCAKIYKTKRNKSDYETTVRKCDNTDMKTDLPTITITGTDNQSPQSQKQKQRRRRKSLA